MEEASTQLNQELRSGYVSRSGFRRLWGAECYGNVSSLGCLRTWLKELEEPLRTGKKIEVEGVCFIHSREELLDWIRKSFPQAYTCFYEDPTESH